MGYLLQSKESTVRSRELGFRLREAMQKAHLTGKEISEKTRIAQSTISRLLSGEADVREVELATLLAVCGVFGKDRDQILNLWQGRHTPGLFWVPGEQRWRVYREHALVAARVIEWSPLMVPWMLQVPDYTRAIVMASGEISREQAGEAIRLRRRLASLVDKATLVVYLHEQSLRTPVCSGATMADQVHQLLRVSVMKSMSLRVVPGQVSGSASVSGPFSVLESHGYRVCPAVYQESAGAGVFFENARQVATFDGILSALSEVALDQSGSRALLRSIVTEVFCV